MFRRNEDMTVEIKSNLRGGVGDLAFRHLFSAGELGGRADLFAAVTLQPVSRMGLVACPPPMPTSTTALDASSG